MAHLCGMLARPGDEARAARTAALAAITALCANQRQSQLNLFQYGGVNTLLQTLLQPERGDAEVLAAATLVERILAPMQECRDIMEGVRGIEVLAQVHREAEERGQAALRTASLRALAQLTFRYAQTPHSPHVLMPVCVCARMMVSVARGAVRRGR